MRGRVKRKRCGNERASQQVARPIHQSRGGGDGFAEKLLKKPTRKNLFGSLGEQKHKGQQQQGKKIDIEI